MANIKAECMRVHQNCLKLLDQKLFEKTFFLTIRQSHIFIYQYDRRVSLSTTIVTMDGHQNVSNRKTARLLSHQRRRGGRVLSTSTNSTLTDHLSSVPCLLLHFPNAGRSTTTTFLALALLLLFLRRNAPSWAATRFQVCIW